jgi:putative Mg2+ transporter-C (MgtC) family protein
MDWIQTNWDEQLFQFGLVLVAGALGAVLGWERELAHKPAGLRTHILVCGTSALLMLLGDSILDTYQRYEPGHAMQADPIRVVQSIVVGISFLGAGTIIHGRRGGVEGLTTAASILLTATIGMAVATRQLLLAVLVTLAALLVLRVVGMLDIKQENPDEVEKT